MRKNTDYLVRLILGALFIAFGILLPIAFHGIPNSWIFLPMHIPVLLCGLICGYQVGAICGIITPLLSSLITGMPPLYPTGVSMMLELCVYGLVCGLLVKRVNYIPALISAMLAGRVVGIAVKFLLVGLQGETFFAALKISLTTNFITVWPGILIQVIAIPLIMAALTKARLVPLEKRRA